MTLPFQSYPVLFPFKYSPSNFTLPNSSYSFPYPCFNPLKNLKILGKEYNEFNELIFEGEYLNGERNGKGKEYDDGKLIFEGEYKNNEKCLIKEYDFNHKLIFDGEYLMERKMEKEKNMMMVN